jgi:hypothetical protein
MIGNGPFGYPAIYINTNWSNRRFDKQDTKTSERDRRALGPHLRAVQKKPHAQGFGPLHKHQPHVPADVVGVPEVRNLGFIPHRISLQPRNSLFNGTPKPGTDFKPFIGGRAGDHGLHLRAGFIEAENFFIPSLKLFPYVPILEKTNAARQITAERDERNQLS